MKLELIKRGASFKYDPELQQLSDVNNHRVTTTDYTVRGKDGNLYHLEIICCTRYNYRKHHKVTGKPLKNPIKEILNPCAMSVNTAYYDADGNCWRNAKLEHYFWNEGLMTYTLENILKAVNHISCDVYDEIVFVE